MKTSILVSFAGSGFLCLNNIVCQAMNKPEKKPNIIVILADDLGYGDLHCYNPDNGKIPTPNIDKLASQGMRFTDAHSSSSVCSPSRYALLTGRYHWRTRLQTGIVNVFDKPLIPADRLTIAGLMKQKGYHTACIGKWHLGWDWPIEPDQDKYVRVPIQPGKEPDVPVKTDDHQRAWNAIFSKPVKGGPVYRGFDSYFGVDVPNWPPFCFIENDRFTGIPGEFLQKPNLRKNLASVQGPAMKDWKLEKVLPELISHAEKFLTESVKSKQNFMLYLALTSPHTPLATNEPWRGKSNLNDYADLVMETDAMVGRLLETLDKTGASENTLVLFTSDNGCSIYIGVEDLIKKGHYPSGPLRGYKMDAWEGGHRIPFIVRWPGVVKPGIISNQLVHQADLMATIADILKVKLPGNAGEDSFSLLPLFNESNMPVRQYAVSTSINGIMTIRQGSWKLIVNNKKDNEIKVDDEKSIQLYNLENDIAEKINLSEKYPARVVKMRNILQLLIDNGRSSSGPKQQNDVPVKIPEVIKTGKK